MRQASKKRGRTEIEITPLKLPHCAYHPRTPAPIYLKVQDKPGVDVCEECYLKLNPSQIVPKAEVSNDANAPSS